jgi:hypothetical protein
MAENPISWCGNCYTINVGQEKCVFCQFPLLFLDRQRMKEKGSWAVFCVYERQMTQAKEAIILGKKDPETGFLFLQTPNYLSVPRYGIPRISQHHWSTSPGILPQPRGVVRHCLFFDRSFALYFVPHQKARNLKLKGVKISDLDFCLGLLFCCFVFLLHFEFLVRPIVLQAFLPF